MATLATATGGDDTMIPILLAAVLKGRQMELKEQVLSLFLYGVKIENTNTGRTFTKRIALQEEASFISIAEIAEDLQDQHSDWIVVSIEYMGMASLYAEQEGQ